MQNIDLSLVPNRWGGWPVREHHMPAFGPTFAWDIEKVSLKQTRLQKQGGTAFIGQVKSELSSADFANANVLDFLLANQHLIPEDWKGKRIYALNTVYRMPFPRRWKWRDLKMFLFVRVHRYIEWHTKGEGGWSKSEWTSFICVDYVPFQHNDHFLSFQPTVH